MPRIKPILTIGTGDGDGTSNIMKLYDLNKDSIKKISNKELLRLHSRVHQKEKWNCDT